MPTSPSSVDIAISNAAASVANTATNVSTNVSNSTNQLINAINSSGVSTIDASAAQISSAVVSDATNLSNNVNQAAGVVKDNANQLYKSPMSTILSICAQALLKGPVVNAANLIIIVHNIMEAVETSKTIQVIKNMSADDRKQLIIDCLHWIVNNDNLLSDDDRLAINILIDTVALKAIDTIMAIVNGESELIAKAESSCLSCLSCKCLS
jgi:hypothetical protein